MYCENCGNKLGVNHLFCEECGCKTNLVLNNANKSNKKLWIILGCLFGCVLLIIIISIILSLTIVINNSTYDEESYDYRDVNERYEYRDDIIKVDKI